MSLRMCRHFLTLAVFGVGMTAAGLQPEVKETPKWTAQLADPLEWLYPDSKVGDVRVFAEADVPINGVVEVNVLVNGLDPEKPVTLSAGKAGGRWYLVYAGKDGPWPSRRMEVTRQGIEDYEMLEAIRRKDPAKADSIIRRMVTSFDDYRTDLVLYRRLRREILGSVR